MGNKEKKEKKEKIFASDSDKYDEKGHIKSKFYEAELFKLWSELVKFQYWVKEKGLKVLIIFEGRDAAGKGGMIKRLIEPLNPRGCRVVALEKPTELERSQWYFQRYVQHLPSAGEIVIFDRSWYNRAVVESVMGFCTEEEREEFLRSCPDFERMLVRSGIVLLKYWFSVSDEEQERRFHDRAEDPNKRWKLSQVDIDGWNKWEDFSRAIDSMKKFTDIPGCRWWDVPADDKKAARLNCISHILEQVPYEDLVPKPIKLPERVVDKSYIRPPKSQLNIIPIKY